MDEIAIIDSKSDLHSFKPASKFRIQAYTITSAEKVCPLVVHAMRISSRFPEHGGRTLTMETTALQDAIQRLSSVVGEALYHWPPASDRADILGEGETLKDQF